MQGKRGRPGPIRGRGVSFNSPNRFERLIVEEDPDVAEEASKGPKTTYLRDVSRTVVARNESPDVGFDRSVNPYRGCEHGCSYCLGPATPVLHADMQWRPIGEVRIGDVLVGFDEFPAPGRTRKFRKTIVQDVWWSKRPTLKLIGDNTEVVTTDGHRWLRAQRYRWSCTHHLMPGRRLRYLPVSKQEEPDEDYRLGYVVGLSLGDGTFRYEPGWRSDKLGFPPAYWRVALADDEPLLRVSAYLGTFGVDTEIRPFWGGHSSRKPMKKVETRALRKLATIHALLHVDRDTRSYRRGFLAGFFDAEGHDGNSLRMTQLDVSVLRRVQRYAASLGFLFDLEPGIGHASSLRLVGRLMDRMGFFSVCRPALGRKMQRVFDREMNLDPERVRAVERGGLADVVDIRTSTGTFFAAGLATHNCYARPTHEYLGFSAGLDFETKILVKEDAPALLRAELAAPRWTPAVVALSGVTDAYQPIERTLGLTRRCLEVLAEFRNPVIVITKNRLVARDADLLAALARDDAAAVFLSVTSLDQGLQRTLEPRTSAPAQRLETIAALARAGVPVGALVAPIIPAVNDHEVPAILAAAARAGARFAGYVPLRLPWAVKDLFERWLVEHLPERREKVLNRIRSLRGGRLNDARFGSRLHGEGPFAEEIRRLFEIGCRKAGLGERPALSTAAFRRPAVGQLGLFR